MFPSKSSPLCHAAPLAKPQRGLASLDFGPSLSSPPKVFGGSEPCPLGASDVLLRQRGSAFYLCLLICLGFMGHATFCFAEEKIPSIAELYLKSGERVEREVSIKIEPGRMFPDPNQSIMVKQEDGTMVPISSLKNIVSFRLYLSSPKGKILCEELGFKNGKLDGVMRYYDWAFGTGTLMAEEGYRKGTPTGFARRYADDGKLYMEYSPPDDKGVKVIKTFYESGTLESEEFQKGDTLIGLKTYYESGALEKDIDGKTYYESGTLKWDGKSKGYYESGALEKEVKDGIVKEYYEEGVLRSERKSDGEGYYRSYYKSGVLKEDQKFKNGVADELYRQFYESGQVQYEHPYENGKTVGVQKRFYRSGALYSETPSENGERRGVVKTYYPTGELWMEEVFAKMNTVVERRKYDRKGKLISEDKGENLPILAYPIPGQE